MPADPDRREAEERDDRAGDPREADEPRDSAPGRDRDPGDLFPWEENEPEPGSGAGLGESGPDRETGDAEAPEGPETAMPRRGHGLMSREKVLWEWPYPGDWIEEARD